MGCLEMGVTGVTEGTRWEDKLGQRQWIRHSAHNYRQKIPYNITKITQG